MDIIERSKKAQESINQMIGENSILKVINENQSKEIERLRKDRDRLRKALREIAEEEYVDPKMTAEEALWYSKEARAALKEKE